MQVRFELIYGSEISYLIVHLHEKAQKDARFDMTLKQEIKKMMVEHDEKDAHLEKKKKKKTNYQNNTGCTWKTLKKG